MNTDQLFLRGSSLKAFIVFIAFQLVLIGAVFRPTGRRRITGLWRYPMFIS